MHKSATVTRFNSSLRGKWIQYEYRPVWFGPWAYQVPRSLPFNFIGRVEQLELKETDDSLIAAAAIILVGN